MQDQHLYGVPEADENRLRENADRAQDPEGKGNAWKWWLAGVLFLATVLTYLDRQTLSLCVPMVQEEMKFGDEQYGQLVAAFRWSYALMHVVAGFAADRLPLRATYAVAVLVWSAAGAAAALTRNFSQLFLARKILGIGEAFNWPCATRIVANMLPPEERGLASGIFNSGSAVGSLIAPIVILPVATLFGWRKAFLAIGCLGIFWVILWLQVTGKSGRARGAVGRASSHPPGGVRRKRIGERFSSAARWVREMLLHPAFWMLLLIGASVNPCWYFLNDWIPKYMHDQRGMTQLSAGMISLPVFLAADLGNLAGGGLVLGLTRYGWSLRRARATTTVLAVLLTLPVAWVTQIGAWYLAVAVLASAAFGMTAILANYTACQQDLSFANVGAVAGILGMASNVCAATVNPWIGRYVDQTGSYRLIFVLLGVLPLVALAAMLTFDMLIWGRRVGSPAVPPLAAGPQGPTR
jgi:ACS family hexuronate transporter-like MFS transporter